MTAVRSRQSAIAAAPGRRGAFCAEEKDLPIAGAARRQRRPLDKAQPQDDRIAIRPARDVRRPRRGRGSGKKDQNWRFRHVLRKSRGRRPALHLGDDC